MFRKNFLLISVLLFITNYTVQFAQDKEGLSEREVKASRKIQFQNRSTLRADQETKQEDIEIGKKISELIEKTPGKTQTYKDISIVRIPVKEEGKFGGDIVTIGKSSTIGHINSLVRILSALIQNSFQYKESDADILALYVLYYNAMHRGDKKYFSKKYNADLNSSLTEAKTGIAVSYKNWPGKTQIVIPIEKNPLKDKKKDTAVDELEDEVNKVIDKKNKGPEEKKKFNDMVDKKTTEEKKQVEVKKREVEKKETKLADNEKKSSERLADLKKDPEKNKQEIKKEETKQQELAKEKEKVAEEKKEVAKKEEQIAKREEKKAEESKKSADGSDRSASDDASGKKPETKEELKKELTETKKEVEQLKKQAQDKEENSQNVVGEKILFLQVIRYDSDGHYTNDLWMLDPVNDDTLYKSPYGRICGKEFLVVPDGVLVLGADETSGNQRKHFLALLDQDKLTLKKSSKEEIFWRTQMIFRDGKIYAFEAQKDQVFLSRFNPDLTLDARSSEPVNTNSDITFNKEKIFITGKSSEGATIKVLQKSDLKVMKTIKPTEKMKPASPPAATK